MVDVPDNPKPSILEHVYDDKDAEAYEDKHVHKVYEQIASHFSQTRYKPWPVVDRFLCQLRPGSVGLDIGCGNGKYLAVNKDVFIIASDRSLSLIDIATHHQPHSTILADTLCLPHPSHNFDFVISIAVIHHLSSRARRIEAIKEISRMLALRSSGRNCGRALIFVWALEQKSSRRGWDNGDEQDVLVPWVLKQQGEQDLQGSRTFQRFYHLYHEGELQSEVKEAGAEIVESGFDRENWWVIMQPNA